MRFQHWFLYRVMCLGVCLTLRLRAQEEDGFKIEFDDSHIRPESVHIQYYLLGEFGGYGDFTDRQKPLAGEILLPLYRGLQRARLVKAILYATGCEIETFAADLLLGPSRAKFECHKLRTTRLRGRVAGGLRMADLTVRLRYTAHWSHAFFGIGDGPVSSFPIADVLTDRDGRFAVEVPDFTSDRVTNFYEGKAEWSLTAGKIGTSEQYWLNAGSRVNKLPGSLAFESEYPKELQFIPQKF
jgi:hypothetical protein